MNEKSTAEIAAHRLRALQCPAPRLSRRKEALCRVCATQAAQSFLRDALTNRRRRPARPGRGR